MPQLYIFIIALVAIFIIVFRRSFVFKKTEKETFKKKIASKVEENRKIEMVESTKRFKDELAREQSDKKYDVNRYKDEIRKAEMQIAKKHWGDAKKYLIQAISYAKDEFSASLKLANVYMESGDYKRAESLYRKLLETVSDNPEIYENIGKILVKKRRYKEAIQAYVKALELDEKDDKKLIALGRLYHLLMHYSVAAECFRRAAELKPREVEYLFLLAESCKADEDLDNALFTYERILTVEPYNEKAKSQSHDLRLKIKENEYFFKVEVKKQQEVDQTIKI